MIVGVDGGALSVSDERLKVGVYKVSRRLLENLSQLDNSNNYRIYTMSEIGEGIFSRRGGSVQTRVLSPRLGWSKIRIPIELFLHPVDVYLGLSQSLPHLFRMSHNISPVQPAYPNTTPGKKNSKLPFLVGFVYDLGFLHNPDAYAVSFKRLSRQTSDLINRADCIVTISHATKSDIVDTYGYPAGNISVLYPGTDRIFSSGAKAYVHKKPYFLYVGALKPGKNIPLALRAFSYFLKKTDLQYDFILAGGDFWPDPEIAETISRYGIGASTILTGFVSDELLATYYRGASALICPSPTEGFCLPAAEAMASGIPVIAVRSGALPEVIGGAGIFVPPGNSADLGRAMQQIVQTPLLSAKLGRSGLHISQKYSWTSFARGVLELYPHGQTV